MTNKPKIVIASIARNVTKTFLGDYERIIGAFSDFEIVNWIIIESNSTDNSKEFLNDFSNSSNIIIHKSISSNIDEQSFRTQELAKARNTYLDIFQKINNRSSVDYLVVCDLNNLNNKLGKNAVNSCWENNEWAALTANQDGPYYDVWALRHKYWNNYDCWERYEELNKFYAKSTLALWDSVYSRMIKIPTYKNWIEVDSAFGGIAIYRTQFIENCRYIGVTSDKKQVCEHVSFNAGITKNGGSIFINPNFINFKLTDHSRRKKYFKYYNFKFYVAKVLKSKLYN
jgi:hypothetical protein